MSLIFYYQGKISQEDNEIMVNFDAKDDQINFSLTKFINDIYKLEDIYFISLIDA